MKPYHLQEAEKDIENAYMLDDIEIMEYLNESDKNKRTYYGKNTLFGAWSNVAIEATKLVKNAGKYPNLSSVADKMLELLKIERTDEISDRAESIVYGTNHYTRAIETQKYYAQMFADGYTHVSDITEVMNGKQATLTGSADVDLFTIKKDSEKIRIVAISNGERLCKIGYMKPRQRTRYYPFSVTSDLFIKI